MRVNEWKLDFKIEFVEVLIGRERFEEVQGWESCENGVN